MTFLHELHDVDLLHAIRDTYVLVRYYESSDGEWAEASTRATARERLDALKHEATKRGLAYMECLQ